MTVPPACQPIADEIEELEADKRALQGDLPSIFPGALFRSGPLGALPPGSPADPAGLIDRDPVRPGRTGTDSPRISRLGASPGFRPVSGHSRCRGSSWWDELRPGRRGTGASAAARHRCPAQAGDSRC
jgi:hypothetical protein